MVLQHQSGVALWRQIADQIRNGLNNADKCDFIDDDGKLSAEAKLAERFDVNRHTVRSAIAALAKENVLKTKRGLGTFAIRRQRIQYTIGQRTRFSQAIKRNSSMGRSNVISSEKITSTPQLEEALELAKTTPVMHLKTISLVNGAPFSMSSHWFEHARFNEMPDHVRQTGSITQGLKACGIEDYTRRSTKISARHANDAELDRLQLAPGAIMLVTEVINQDAGGKAIQTSTTTFQADLTDLSINH